MAVSFVVGACMPLLSYAAGDNGIATNDGLEAKVRAYFADVPVMAEIARCESRFRQYDGAGVVLRGGFGGEMIGLFQIYGRIHRAEAAALGFDIDTPEGNMGYARHLYESQGTDPWRSSATCWGSATVATDDRQARIAALQAQVVVLLRLLVQLQTAQASLALAR